MNTVETFRNKHEVVAHIVRCHPELVWPDRSTLNKYNRDNLDSLHRDLHNPPPPGLS